MKKIAIILAASLMLIGVNAMGQASIGAGFLNSTTISKYNSSSNSEASNGFYAGVGYTVPVAEGLNFTPGVYFEYTAQNGSVDLFFFTATGKQQDMYIDVPLHFSYGFNMGSGLRFFVYGGPSANVAVASKFTATVGKTSDTIDILEKDSNLKRFDVMLGGGVGLVINDMVRFQVGYDWGMLNRYASNNYSLHRNQLTAGVAFLF